MQLHKCDRKSATILVKSHRNKQFPRTFANFIELACAEYAVYIYHAERLQNLRTWVGLWESAWIEYCELFITGRSSGEECNFVAQFYRLFAAFCQPSIYNGSFLFNTPYTRGIICRMPRVSMLSQDCDHQSIYGRILYQCIFIILLVSKF